MQELLLESLKLGGRTIAIYIAAVVMVKLMGKRELGQLSPVDFIVGVIIGSVSAAPMVDLELPLLPTLVPIVVLGTLEIIASLFALKNRKARLLLEDKPTVLISDGKVLTKNMADVRMTMDDLKQELRVQGIVDINQVAEGTLESGGRFSVIKKPEYQPLTAHDLQTVTLHNFDRVLADHMHKTRLDLHSVINKLDRRH